ncbi:MAG: DMT family transporter [Cyclobacteriaceae bacterium]|nr:DMT family transporter [Cyclobacteriaceae bacterium SS2]
MLIATFTFSLMKVCVKVLSHIPPIEIILFRSIISLIICVYFLHKQNVSIWGKNKKILILRGASGAAALVLYFGLLQQIPLAAAATVLYMSPIFAAILGIFLVRERVAPIQWLFFLISFGGVLTITGFDTRISLTHLIIGISSTVFSGLAYNFIRILKTSEHPLVIIFYFPLVTLPIAGTWSTQVWVQPNGWDWLFLILVGVFTQIAQFFMTKSYQTEELSKVAIINYTSIIYVLGFGWIFFGEQFNFMTYIGMGLVLLGVVANVVFKK